MKLLAINWTPTDRQLKQFGVICLIALPLVGWIWHASSSTLTILSVIGIGVAGLGLAFPRALRPLFVALSLITVPIGLVIGELVLLSIYFGLFVPLGLFFRVTGRDALQLRIDRDLSETESGREGDMATPAPTQTPPEKTYWQPKQQPTRAATYYRQF
jgi:hypothetical protein